LFARFDAPGGRRYFARLDFVATSGYIVEMRKVGIRALKNGLSGYIRAVAAGETLLVTDRDRVVAQITPPLNVGDGRDSVWAEMIRSGEVTPAKIPPEARVPPTSLNIMTFDDLMAEIEADREDR
jgi:antitoxin (DNA-binding transcriptional repressor) of toxin-antitoxin stability system